MTFIQKSFFGFIAGGIVFSTLQDLFLPYSEFRYYKRTFCEYFFNTGSFIGLILSISFTKKLN